MHCRCSAQMPPPPLPAAKLPSTPWSSSIQTPDPLFKRRDFTSCALLLALINPPQLRAEISPSPPPSECLQSESPTKKAFIDVSIDGEPIGRILIGLYTESAPRGAARFSNLVSGKSGVTYRRKEFVKIMPNYIQHGGLRSFGVDAEVARKTGTNLTTADALLEEWIKQKESNNCAAANNSAKSVSIIIRDPMKSPPKLKLIARKGRLEIDEEAMGVDPNGTEFAIALRDSPELDEAALVVGRVVGGMDVVERIAQVRTVQENSSSPYFRVAKLIGDKRAVVAERGFNRPYSKVVITNCGLIDS